MKEILRQIYLNVAKFVRFFYDKYYYKKCRKRLKNDNFTIITPNCYAGIMYHRLGKQFLSPTINLYFPERKKYLKFVSDLKYYLSRDLEFIESYENNNPTAKIDDIIIVFNHYKTNEQAEKSWNSRKARVNYDNVFIVFDDIEDVDAISYEDLLEFNKVDCKGKVIFTAKEYDNLPNAVTIDKYRKTGKLEHYLTQKNNFTGKNPADMVFDFVAWLNGEKFNKKG